MLKSSLIILHLSSSKLVIESTWSCNVHSLPGQNLASQTSGHRVAFNFTTIIVKNHTTLSLVTVILHRVTYSHKVWELYQSFTFGLGLLILLSESQSSTTKVKKNKKARENELFS